MGSVTEEKFEFKTEIQELLHLIVHTLYTHKEIFLRELLSNAADALSKVQFETLTNPDIYDKDQSLDITLKIDKENKTLKVIDTGVGMSHDQLIQQIGTVAHSGTKQFLEQVKKKQSSPELIGKFGVGFYSVFMVADKVTIDTKSYLEKDEAVFWESDGKGAYTVRPSQRRKRGTEITLHLKEDAQEYLETYRIEQLVRQYSNYLPFNVMLDDKKINQPEALWRKPKKDITEDEYKEFYKQVSMDFQDPLHWEHLSLEAPVQFSAIVYIPSKAPYESYHQPMEHGLKLYAKRVFIQDDCKSLLPNFLRFLKGVVDSEDIPLNVSRETIQNDLNIVKINKVITKKVLDALKKLARDDQERYLEFWEQHGRFLKEGAHSDFAHREKIIPLLQFHSTQQADKPSVTLAQYREGCIEGQKAIYYAIGDSLSQLRRSPHLEFFQKHGIEVLLLTEPMDDLVLTALGEYESLKFINVESAELELPDELKKEVDDVEVKGDLKKLEDKVRSVLQDKVNKVRFSRLLSDSPCRFFNAEGGMSHTVRKLMMNMDGVPQTPLKRDLELNPEHPFVVALSNRLGDESVDDGIKLLFHLANLLEGSIDEPQELAGLITPLLK